AGAAIIDARAAHHPTDAALRAAVVIYGNEGADIGSDPRPARRVQYGDARGSVLLAILIDARCRKYEGSGARGAGACGIAVQIAGLFVGRRNVIGREEAGAALPPFARIESLRIGGGAGEKERCTGQG